MSCDSEGSGPLDISAHHNRNDHAMTTRRLNAVLIKRQVLGGLVLSW